MQNRYSAQKRLGVAWYLYPDEDNTDGGHTSYLEKPEEWEDLDPMLFGTLKELVNDERRSVEAIESSGILPRAVFANEILDTDIGSYDMRENWRREWFKRLRKKLANCNLVFVDPDNGLYPDESFRHGTRKHWKRLPLNEALTLSEGRPVILYHHNGRHRGTHRQEIRYWMDQIPGCSYAFYWLRISPRTFFIVNPDGSIIKRLTKFAEKWKQAGELICE